MKITTLEKYVFDHFSPKGGALPSLEEASMANVVMHLLLNASGFQGTYGNHQLFEWAPGFLRLGALVAGKSTPTFCDVFQDYYSSNHWCEQGKPRWIEIPKGTFLQPPLVPRVPEEVAKKAHLHLSILQERHADIHSLLAPSSQALAQRQLLQVEQVTDENLAETVAGITGSHRDPHLKRSGILYHHPTASNARKKESPWVYWVAHNGDEIAGVLGAMKSEEEKSLSLSYVSVAPGFRNQGLSKRLMKAVMDYGFQQELFLARSSPGVFSQDHPEVAQGLDRCVMGHAVPHVSGNSYLVAGSLERARRKLPWEVFCSVAKPMCDEWLRKCPSLQGRWEVGYAVEEAFAQEFNDQVDIACDQLEKLRSSPVKRRGP